jgi:hypothetical protein
VHAQRDREAHPSQPCQLPRQEPHDPNMRIRLQALSPAGPGVRGRGRTDRAGVAARHPCAAPPPGEDAARRRSRGRFRRANCAPVRRSSVLPCPFGSGGRIPATSMPEPSTGRARHATQMDCRRHGCTMPAPGRRDQRMGLRRDGGARPVRGWVSGMPGTLTVGVQADRCRAAAICGQRPSEGMICAQPLCYETISAERSVVRAPVFHQGLGRSWGC